MAFLPSRILPWWPHILFVIIEPLALLLGAYQTFISPTTFLSRLVPSSYRSSTTLISPSTPLPAETAIVTFQLSNTMLLLSLTLPLILTLSSTSSSTTTQPHPSHSLARAFLILLSLADLGHVYATYAGMGAPTAAAFWDVARWNGMLWGQVGGSLFLCVQRLLTAGGGFGPFVGEVEGGRVGRGKRD